MASYLLNTFGVKIYTMKRNIILSTVLIASSIITLNSCKKKQEVDNETQSVVDNAICEQQFMAIQPVVNSKGISEKGIKRTMSSCESWNILGALGNATITPSANDTIDVNGDGLYDNGPVTFQIDYGTTGCLGNDGVLKYGKINITLAKRWSVLTNNQITVDLVSFKSAGTTYSGQIKITRPDAVTLTVEVINGHCTDGSWNIDYAATKTVKQIGPGVSTPDESDDEIEITGNSTGTSREGRAFSTNISSALHKKSSCKFITSGTLDLTPDGFKTRTVDFGSGTCDDDATYTVNGQTISFKLR